MTTPSGHRCSGKGRAIGQVVVWILCLILTATAARSEPHAVVAAVTTLRFPPGARAWGMGGAGGAVPDPFVGYFNPGGLGVYSLGNPVALARNNQEWVRNTGVRYSNTLVIAGMNLFNRGDAGMPVSVGIGLGFHHQMFDYGEFLRTDERGNVLNRFRAFDRSDNFTVAAGFERGIEAGIGITLKAIKSAVIDPGPQGGPVGSTGTTTGRDVGVFARVPIARTLQSFGIIPDTFRIGPLTPELAIAASEAWTNRGTISYSKAEPSAPLPRSNRSGYSAALSLAYQGAGVFEFTIARDIETDKVGPDWVTREGWEANLLGIFRISRGQFWFPRLVHINSDDDKNNTEGLSIHLNGLILWMNTLNSEYWPKGMYRVIQNLDIYYQRSQVLDRPYSPGMKLSEVGLTYRLPWIL